MKYIVTLVLIGCVITSFGYSQECAGCDGPGHLHKHKEMKALHFEMLELTEDQKETIEQTRVDAMKTIVPLKAEIELKRIDLKQEFGEDTPNRSRIMNLVEGIHDLELKIKQTKIDERLKIHSVLTPEQREQMKKMPSKQIKKKIMKKFHEEDMD